MSTNDELHEQRLQILEGRVEPEYLEGLINESDEPDEVEETQELLEEYGEEFLSDTDAIEDKLEYFERKVNALGSVLPEDRLEEIEAQREALRGASEVANSFLDNSPEALAERIHQ